ncbi:MAG: response regulator [Proteobacteria bacterium]|nr:response regulator [Pseudomonadota bacterium]
MRPRARVLAVNALIAVVWVAAALAPAVGARPAAAWLAAAGVLLALHGGALALVGRRPRPARTRAALAADWLFRASPVGIARLDLGGRIRESNPALAEIVAAAPGTLMGCRLDELVAPEDRGDLAAQLSKLVMGLAPRAHLDVHLAGRKGGSAALTVAALAGPEGGPAELVAHVVDTTEQRSLEAQFAQSQKMQALGLLAGGVAHDFNNVLTAISGFCDLLLQRHRPGDPSHPDIRHIRDNTERAAGLVRQLLAFSRRQTLQPRVIDLAAALARLEAMLTRLIGEKVALSVEVAPGTAAIRVDPAEFDRAVVNLAVNARDAMAQGGRLSIRARNAAVAAPLQHGDQTMPAGSYVLVEVADTGAGIPAAILPRIFEPFFTTKEAGAGTGLGLSSVYGVVRQTGGYIFVESEVGAGTTFRIYLPAVGEAVPGRASEAASPPPAANPPTGDPPAPAGARAARAHTVLLVEDEDAVRLFAVRALRQAGHSVLAAASGEEALDLLAAAPAAVDVLVSDVVMPGMDGGTLARLLRERRPGLPVILMSGYAEDALGGEVALGESVAFLSKPFSLEELTRKVAEVLAGRDRG